MKPKNLYTVKPEHPITGFYTPTAGSKGNGRQFIERINRTKKKPAEWR